MKYNWLTILYYFHIVIRYLCTLQCDYPAGLVTFCHHTKLLQNYWLFSMLFVIISVFDLFFLTGNWYLLISFTCTSPTPTLYLSTPCLPLATSSLLSVSMSLFVLLDLFICFVSCFISISKIIWYLSCLIYLE